MQEQAREGKARASCVVAIACGAVSTGGTDHDRLAALRSLAGLWLVSKGADLDAALRAWALVLTVVDVRTLSTPLIDTTLEHLATFLSVCIQCLVIVFSKLNFCDMSHVPKTPLHVTLLEVVQGSNVAVRSSAAEALGLLYAQCGLHQLPDNDDDLVDESDLETSSVAVGSNAGSLDCSSCGVSEDARTALQMGFDGIIAQIEALSKNRCCYLVVGCCFPWHKCTVFCCSWGVLSCGDWLCRSSSIIGMHVQGGYVAAKQGRSTDIAPRRLSHTCRDVKWGCCHINASCTVCRGAAC